MEAAGSHTSIVVTDATMVIGIVADLRRPLACCMRRELKR